MVIKLITNNENRVPSFENPETPKKCKRKCTNCRHKEKSSPKVFIDESMRISDSHDHEQLVAPLAVAATTFVDVDVMLTVFGFMKIGREVVVTVGVCR